MNDFFYKYIDLVTLLIALSWILGVSFRTWKKRDKGLRLGMVMLVYFGPVLLLSSMLTHLAEITFHGIDSGFTGMFSLRFHLYSLYLMAFVLGNTGIYLYRGTQQFLTAEMPDRKVVLRPAALIALILFPLLWLTPLSYVMYAACGISLGATFWVRKKPSADADLEMFSLQEATAG